MGLASPSLVPGLLEWMVILQSVYIRLMVIPGFPNLYPLILVEHLLFFILHLCVWDRPTLYGCCSVLFIVYLNPFLKVTLWTAQQGGPVGPMGCTHSSIDRTVCKSDETEFLTRWKRASVDNSIGSSQSSSDISFIKLEEKDNQNIAAGALARPTGQGSFWSLSDW